MILPIGLKDYRLGFKSHPMPGSALQASLRSSKYLYCDRVTKVMCQASCLSVTCLPVQEMLHFQCKYNIFKCENCAVTYISVYISCNHSKHTNTVLWYFQITKFRHEGQRRKNNSLEKVSTFIPCIQTHFHLSHTLSRGKKPELSASLASTLKINNPRNELFFFCENRYLNTLFFR